MKKILLTICLILFLMIGAKSVLAQACCNIDPCPLPSMGSIALCDMEHIPSGESCDTGADGKWQGYCVEVEDHDDTDADTKHHEEEAEHAADDPDHLEDVVADTKHHEEEAEHAAEHHDHGGVLPSIGRGAQGISECYKLRTNVKLKMPGGVSDTTFVKKVVIAPRPLSGLECKHASVSGVRAKCGASPIMNSTCYTTEFGIIVLLDYLNFITGWLFYILMLLVTIFIIYGGFLVITAAGDPEKSGKGKQVVTYAIIGLAVALLARVIPALVSFIIGV